MNTFTHIWARKLWSVIQFMLWVLAWTDPLSKPVSVGGLRLRRVLQSQGEINMVGKGDDLPVWVRSPLPLMPITPSCHQLHTDTLWTAPLSCNPVGLYQHLRHPERRRTSEQLPQSHSLSQRVIFYLHITLKSCTTSNPICAHAVSGLEMFSFLWNSVVEAINQEHWHY